MDEYSRGSRSGAGWVIGACLLAIVILVGVICAFGALFSIKGTDSGEVCVVREGGPFDGRDIKEVRQPGEGPKIIGIWNNQDCLPSTERDWVLSSSAAESDNEDVDRIAVSTSDAVNVYAEGQALFRLTTDPEKIRRFYRAYGRRKWDGKDIKDDQGFINFLRIRFRPVLVDSLRQAIGAQRCTSLNNLCQYMQEADTTIIRGEVREIDTTQNLAEAQAEVAEKLREGLRASLGDDYFEGIQYQNLRVDFDEDQKIKITEAQTKRTEVATARLEAERRREIAEGQTAVAREEAEQIALKARSYERSPAQAEIDKIKALCGEGGCTSLQVLGSGSGVIANLR